MEDKKNSNMTNEIWKDIPESNGIYQVSTLGNCRKVLKNGYRYITGGVSPKGYITWSIVIGGKSKAWRSHRVIAMTFIPNPDNKSTVNHKNGIKTDNRVENLEWMTALENIRHAFVNDLAPCFEKGSLNNNAILTEKKVLEIRSKYIPNVYTRQMLADEYQVKLGTVKDILIRRSWNHI